ncbi:hypothetical protein B566_EDAN006212 [Ephemera danica]|nr:hypothetical protein B566_EDAN006212 [Ephemera danica]
MNSLVIFAAFLAVASAAPGLAPGLSGILLPKVNVGPTEVNVVKQRYTVQQPEYIHREVPVAVPVVRHEVVQPVVQPHITTYSAPVVSTYAAAPAVYGAQYAAPALYGAQYAASGVYGAHFAAPYAANFGAVKYF